MKNKKCSTEEARMFIEYIKQLDEQQQVGLLKIIQGASLLYDKNSKKIKSNELIVAFIYNFLN